jgi:hypothetical protein
MRHYTILRLLLAAFLLYFAWPYIPEAVLPIEKLFWGVWLGFLLLVIGGNLATLLQISAPPVMEQEIPEKKRSRLR